MFKHGFRQKHHHHHYLPKVSLLFYLYLNIPSKHSWDMYLVNNSVNFSNSSKDLLVVFPAPVIPN